MSSEDTVVYANGSEARVHDRSFDDSRLM